MPRGEAGPMENVGGSVKAACALDDVRLTDHRMTAQTDREKRLADALRNNLRRRKEQAREKEQAPGKDGEERAEG
jgi:hypothetical protein